MRVAHILWGFSTGGIETMLVDIVSEQAKLSEVAVFILNDKVDHYLTSKLETLCMVFCFHRKEGSINPWPVISLNMRLTSFNPDIIHYHSTGLSKLTISPKPKVITIHNVHSNPDGLNRFDKIFAISNAVKEHLEIQGLTPVTITNGIQVESIQIRENKQNHRKLKMVQVGRLYHPHKGQHILLGALDILVNKEGIDGFSLDFIGSGESQDYLKSLVERYNLSKYVSFLGNLPREYIYSHLKDYDLCIQPSLSEGFGLTVAEAMVARVPVIVSNVPGTMEVIGNGRFGISFESGDPFSLSKKLSEFLTCPTEPEYLDTAREYACRNFDISVTAHKYLEEYGKVIKK